MIINYIHDSAMTGTKEIYRWEGKKLQLVRKGDIIWDETNPDILVLRIAQTDPEWGELTVIHTRSQDVNTASEAEILSMHQERDTLLFEGLE